MIALVRNVMRENLRNRALYILTGVGVLLMLALLATPSGTLTDASGRNLLEDLSGTMRVGFAIMGLLGALVTVVLSMNTIPREFERQTIHLLLVRPVARWQLAGSFLTGNVLTAWVFLLGLSIPLFAALAVRDGSHLMAALATALLAPLLNTAIVAAVTTLLSTRLPGPASAFLSLVLYGVAAFGSTLANLAGAADGLKGWLMQAGLTLVPPTDAVASEALKLLGTGAVIDGRVFAIGLLYLWLVAGLTAAGLYGREA